MESRANRGEWLVNVADDVVVPMTTLEVVDGLRKGRLSEQSLVWRIGMHDWTALVEVPQLRLAAGSVPPPAIEETAAPLGPQLPSMAMQSSLAPTTAQAEAESSVHASSTWNSRELEELLSGERRADQSSSRRALLGAALASAALAAVFTLLVLRSPLVHHARSPTRAVLASTAPAPPSAPAPMQAPEAAISSSASASEHTSPPGTASSLRTGVAPRAAKRLKRTLPAPVGSAPPSAPQPDPLGSPAGVAVLPSTPLGGAASAGTQVPSPPASSAPIEP